MLLASLTKAPAHIKSLVKYCLVIYFSRGCCRNPIPTWKHPFNSLKRAVLQRPVYDKKQIEKRTTRHARLELPFFLWQKGATQPT